MFHIDGYTGRGNNPNEEKCKECHFMKIKHEDDPGHCYMFEEVPAFDCKQFQLK